MMTTELSIRTNFEQKTLIPKTVAVDGNNIINVIIVVLKKISLGQHSLNYRWRNALVINSYKASNHK